MLLRLLGSHQNVKFVKHNIHVRIFNFNDFTFLEKFKIGNKEYDALVLPKQDGPYVVLETFNRDNYRINGGYIINMN